MATLKDLGENTIPSSEDFVHLWDSSEDVDAKLSMQNLKSLTTNSLESEISSLTNIYGSKNLLINGAESQVISGVTFTVNDDKSISASGTASAKIELTVVATTKGKVLEAGSYIISGCPTNGGQDRYSLEFTGTGVDPITAEDYGSGDVFTLPSTDTDYVVKIVIQNGVAINGSLVFKPMIRPASLIDNTYVPYIKTNKELTDDVTQLNNDLNEINAEASVGGLPKRVNAITEIYVSSNTAAYRYFRIYGYKNTNTSGNRFEFNVPSDVDNDTNYVLQADVTWFFATVRITTTKLSIVFRNSSGVILTDTYVTKIVGVM